jgi:EAL domain-containing protein (putative c-di-GMP-specific phosphodiesterase class I)
MTSEPSWSDRVSHLRNALNDDAFALYCQPIAALGGLVLAYPMGEVLIRLREEESALLPPGEFLPVLEHYGLMPHLDRWVVRTLFRRVSIGSRIAHFCINLSVQTLADHGFPNYVADELVRARMPGNCALFEIEEHEVLASPASVARFAALIGSLGAGVVLDGFGRTPDALQLLVDVPCVRAVKLHFSITRRLLSEGRSNPELDHLLCETAARKIAVVAECVEEPEALRRLQSLKIGFAQGFGVYKPQPLEVFIEPHALAVA